MSGSIVSPIWGMISTNASHTTIDTMRPVLNLVERAVIPIANELQNTRYTHATTPAMRILTRSIPCKGALPITRMARVVSAVSTAWPSFLVSRTTVISSEPAGQPSAIKRRRFSRT